MSTWMCENLRCGVWQGVVPDSVCLVILDVWHCWHCFDHVVASFFIPCQTNFEVRRVVVALAEGWLISWMHLNTSRRRGGGTHGRGLPVLMSQRSAVAGSSVSGTLCHVSAVEGEESSASCRCCCCKAARLS